MSNRLFRNNRGTFYTLDKARKVRAGLEAKGASDLIGTTTIKITPEMVGMHIAVFTAVECKRGNWKKPSTDTEKDQVNFIAQVRKRGGIGFFITDHKQLEDKIKKSLEEMIDAHEKTSNNMINKFDHIDIEV